MFPLYHVDEQDFKERDTQAKFLKIFKKSLLFMNIFKYINDTPSN